MSQAKFAGGRFDVIREIGRGGMGAVYEVYDREHDLRLALKTVTRLDPYRVIQLKREFRSVSGLRHRNLVQLYELVAEDEGCFFTMELLRGIDVRAWVRDVRELGDLDWSVLAHADTGIAPPSGAVTDVALPADSLETSTSSAPGAIAAPRAIPFDEVRLRQTIAELASGLAFLHEHGVVHRDIKPSNALVSDEGRVVLLDFGLAADWRPQPGRRATSAPPLAGTIAYMAPEYLHGQVVSPGVDTYALGVLAYELITGAPPFSGSLYEIVSAHIEQDPTPAAALNAALPSDLDRLILDLLAKDPAARPSAAQARARALGEQIAEGTPQPRARPPFIGRSEELEVLSTALAATRAGAPRLMVVEGASGAGKTALVEEFIYRLPLGETAVFRGRCYEREAVPYRAFDEIAEELAVDLGEGDDIPIGAPSVPRHVSALARVFSAFAALADPNPAPAGDARDERERAMGAFADLLALRIGASAGAVLAIDDLQWADAGSLELLTVLLERTSKLPLFVVVTVRQEDRAAPRLATFLAQAEERGVAQTLRLGPLARDDLRELLDSVASQPVGETTLQAIERATDGSPYAASAIAHELAALGPSPRSGDIDVRALEAARIERLSHDERRVADAASAATGAVSFAELRSATELPGPRLLSALHALERARLLRASATPEGHAGYDIYHQRLRELAYSQLSDDVRAQLHRRFAEAIAAQGEARGLERLSRQWELAGERERAADSALAAADEARRQLAFERAADLYDRALSLGLSGETRAAARERRAEAVLLSNNFERSAALCRELAAERDGVERERWLVRCAEAEIKLGDLERGIDTLELVLKPKGLKFRKRSWSSVASAAGVSARVLTRRRRETSVTPDDDVLAELYRVVAYFLSTPYPREAWEYVLRFVDHARDRGDRGREACGFAMLAGYLEVASLGRLGGHFLVRARRAASRADDPYADLVVEAVSAMRAAAVGAWVEMRDHATRGYAICRDMGMEGSWEASFLRTYHGLTEIYAGEIDAALDILATFLRSRRRPDLFSRVLATAAYGRALLYAGKTEQADEILAELEASPLASVSAVGMWTATLRGELALSRGDYRIAAAVAKDMHRAGKEAGLAYWPAISAMRNTVGATAQLGLALTGTDRAASAHRAHRHAQALLRAGRGSFYEPTALRLMAQAHDAAGNRARAERDLDRAASAAELRGGRLERAAIAALRGERPPGADPALSWITAGALHVRTSA